MNKLLLIAATGTLLVTGTETAPAQAVTLQEATQARLEFFDPSGTQIGQGQFQYGSEPFEGVFYQGEGLEFAFFSMPLDLSDIDFSDPDLFLPDDSVIIDASDGLRLVENINLSIRGAEFTGGEVPVPGSDFSNVLFFEPPDRSVYPPGGDLFSIDIGDPRGPRLGSGNSWFLGDTGGSVLQQLLINANGSFFGFDANLPGEASDLSGTWRAVAIPDSSVAVPEPNSGLSLLAFGFGMSWFYKKKRCSGS